jgi:N-acetylmuramoyl-L-alanine amidase
VLVLDPGHGGLDSGTRVHGVLEKDLTLVLALRLRATLQARLNATIILTREQDRALDIEDRSAIANQSRADLLISLHVGYSEDETESSGAVFVMKSPQSTSPGPRNAFFVPWYEAHLDSRDASLTFATTLRQRLSANVPEWPVAVREAPLAVLASVTSAAVVVELGNANNPADLARLATPTFQNRVIEAIVESVQAIGVGDPGDD